MMKIIDSARDDIGDRRIDIEDPPIIEAHQNTCRDHFARRRDQRNTVGVELAPILLVHHSVVAIDDDQPGPVRPLF